MVGNDGKKMNFWNPSTLENNILNTFLILSNGWIARGKSTTKQGKYSTFLLHVQWLFVDILRLEWPINWRSTIMEIFPSSDGGIHSFITTIFPVLSFLIALFVWRRFSNFAKRKIRKKVVEIHFVLDLITFCSLYPLQPSLTCPKSKLSYHVLVVSAIKHARISSWESQVLPYFPVNTKP